MDHHSHTPMNMNSSGYNNPLVPISSSSGPRSCFVFGVELFATKPLSNRGREKMPVNICEGNDNTAAPIATVVCDENVQITEAYDQLVMSGTVSLGSNNDNGRRNHVDLFPEDAKDLLSTGIFDGVFVAYGGSAREPEKRQFAMIHGNSFLCACLICNGRKYVSARKLEHHAGYETKHPNSGIYFASGISIFKAVQILRKTPRNKLFEKIRTITGSVINEENFAKWRASYLAGQNGYGSQGAPTS